MSEPTVPVRIPGHRLFGENQKPGSGMHRVTEDEAVQIIRGMVGELGDEKREEVMQYLTETQP